MKSQSVTHFIFLLLISFFLVTSQLNAQWVAKSYSTLINEAFDIVVIKVNRIEGEIYGEKSIAQVERSFKGRIKSDSIELPFVYSKWPTGKNSYESTTDVVTISFEIGKRYVVFLVKRQRTSLNPYAAETEYEVLNYPKRTYFEIKDDNNSSVQEVELLLKISEESDSDTRVESLLSLIQNDTRELRIDAIEALIDLKTERAAIPFIYALYNDSDPEVRLSAARGLGYLHSDSIASALIECLKKEKVDYIKSRIISSISMLRVRTAVPILLGFYESEGYDIRNVILEAVSKMGDSTAVPELIHLFSIDQDAQHRHLMVQTIASFHTPKADQFSSALLDTAKLYRLKAAVIDGWAISDYTKGFDKIAKWTSIQCASEEYPSQSVAQIQGLVFPLLSAIEKLGTPEQIASTLKVYATCNDPAIRQKAVRILRKQLEKDITPKLRDEIELEIKTFPSQ